MVAPNITFVETERSRSPASSTRVSEGKHQPEQSQSQPQPQQRGIILEEAPCTPPSGNTVVTLSLEERVSELEEKLATMSKLMQQRASFQSLLCNTPPILDIPASSDASVPPLDSPFPSEPRRANNSRSLSCKILNEGLPKLDVSLDGVPQTPVISNQHSPKTLIVQFDASLDEGREGKADMKNEPAKIEAKAETPTKNNNLERRHRSESITSTTSETKSIRQKWMDYLETFQESTPDVDVQMEEFVRVPSSLESLLSFGFAICVDCFLYLLTMLPLKFIWGLILVVVGFAKKEPQYKFHRRHFYTFLQVTIIFLVYRFVLVPISIGRLYHWIRSQAMLKLYVLIAIMEVFDRLMCSMGQDCLDSMYWNTTRRPKSIRMLVSFVVVLVYAMCHTLILFVHVATMNVAINSADQALLTLLISGNFAEIKSTVFKKYNKPNLFKITASDICERFKLAFFLSLVFLLNLCQGMEYGQIFDFFKMCGIVWCAEMCADWIKHSFITKFNFISSKVYPQYALLLAGDVTGIGHEGVNLDRSHAVVKRIGFAQIPMACVMLRMVREAARYYSPSNYDWFLNERGSFAVMLIAAWCILFVVKLMLGEYLQRICQTKLEAGPELLAQTPSIKKPKSKKS